MGTRLARNRLDALGIESRGVTAVLAKLPGLGFLDRVSEVTVDDHGVTARSRREAVLDLLVDGRRVYSFWLHRDGTRVGGRWQVPWPRTLQEFLDGTAEFAVVVHETGEQVFQREVSLGSGAGRIKIVNRNGQPLSLDKSWRRVVTFDTRSAANIEPLMHAIEVVLEALREAGIEAFLAYGTLLGAVREGKLLGHDSDADLGYVSRHTHPVDVIRESFRIQRALVGLGYRITRYSALAFKVDVEEGDGVVRGLDVFGGFLMDGHLHLMGEIREPFEESWIFPLGTTTLEGRTFPAPADPDRLLTATYGPWRVPDPAFKFAPPATTVRRLNGWFRGLRVGRARWDRIYSRVLTDMPEPSPFVHWVAEREPEIGAYVDLGCGRGADVLHLAERGVPALGLDFQARSYAAAEQQAAADPGLNELVTFWPFNLLELRQLLVVGAIVARRPGPRVLAARHLVDTLKPAARRRLWRVARMMLAGDGPEGAAGRFYLEFLARKGDDGYAGRHRVRRRKPAMIVAELESWGATVVHRETIAVSDSPGASRVCRLVVEWRRGDG
jgi:SAM-dependent methyltransferase